MIYLYTFPGNEPLPWSTRVQIALDWARGLEYMHEHTVPVYIHRDIKSAYILIDKNFHGKVADFGLAKLTEVGVSLPTCLVGTFGYMPPELSGTLCFKTTKVLFLGFFWSKVPFGLNLRFDFSFFSLFLYDLVATSSHQSSFGWLPNIYHLLEVIIINAILLQGQLLNFKLW
ncbi:probable serine/threonine-protein kinase PBL7 isoform X1 [Rhododendron vialii]|uniref:probable serine/threonine-protein kinase PBL7 isoform X1 n=1 Tax=Rhododendron vialii TaxID=182163 RepID=UPI00265D793F|nr:probable serine/threonine-protein kinase PBL7 isoform X1 [Rhododendron vialii]